jgi:hypothetical protein
LSCATADPSAIAGVAVELLGEVMPVIERRGITLVGLTVTNLDGDAEQLTLDFGT